MLGHKVYQTLLTRFPGTACTIRGRIDGAGYRKVGLFRSGKVFEGVDVLGLEGLETFLREERPSVLVNCVGIIKQREEADIPIPAITINALLPHKLAEWAGRWGGRVIHFSTDCVFSGKRGRYTEDDASDAEDLYGRSKFLGEVRTPNALTLRTSIIGRELSHFRSLLEWFLSQKGKTVKGYTRVIYSGVTTNSLAELVARVIEKHPALSGLYQVSAAPISKHDLLVKLREAFRLDIEIIPDETTVNDRSLVGERFARATGFKVPPWNELVAQLAADPTPYESWQEI
jgi:dTDP-4-dehydrorhamnose reductase